MKHQGKNPAIYATKTRAYGVFPGDEVPRNAQFVISHWNRPAMDMAYDHSTCDSTKGNGPRRQRCAQYGYFLTLVELTLQQAVSRWIEPVTEAEFQILRHALGSAGLSNARPDLGWRNSFLPLILVDVNAANALCERGLMEKVDYAIYRATERGAILAGVHPDDAAAIQKRWLRLQAEAAIVHATSGDKKVAIDNRAMMHTSGSTQTTDLETLMNAYQGARHNAAMRLIEMDLLQENIVRLGGRV